MPETNRRWRERPSVWMAALFCALVLNAAAKPLVVYAPLGLEGMLTLQDGQAIGLHAEVLRSVSRASGVPIEIRAAPWPVATRAFEEGQADILGPVMGPPWSIDAHDYSVALTRMEWARYVKRGQAKSPAGLYFSGMRIAVIADSFGSRWLEREHGGSRLVPVSNIAEGLNAVLEDRADAFVGLKLPSRRLLRERPDWHIEEVGIELAAPMRLAVARGAAEDLPAINRAIVELSKSGEADRLLEAWLPAPPPTAAEVRQNQFMLMLGAVALVAIGLAIALALRSRQLASLRDKAYAAERAKGEFVAVISHEIRTPINGVVNLIDLLKRSGPTPEQALMLQDAEKASQTLLHLVNDVLDFSKIQSSELPLRPVPTDLRQVFDQVHAVLGAQIRSDAVGLTVMPPPGGMPTVEVDALRLQQILTNLGTNALKFTREGSVSVRVEQLEIPKGEQDPVRLRFEVRDTGPGIPASEQHLLFQPYVQLSTAAAQRGTGLGLVTCAALIRRMGSTLEVDSEPGVGSRFWFDLNLPRAACVVEAPSEAVGAAYTTEGVRGKVLVVDDNPLNLLVTRKMLQQEGYEVIQSVGVRDALRLLTEEGQSAPDLILMDLQMPDIDGIQGAMLLRQQMGSSAPPVVAISGAVTEALQQAARDAGMVGFIPKPFERAGLLNAVRLALS